METKKEKVKQKRLMPKRTLFEQIEYILKYSLAFYILYNTFDYFFRVTFDSGAKEATSNLIIGFLGGVFSSVVAFYFVNQSKKKDEQNDEPEKEENKIINEN